MKNLENIMNFILEIDKLKNVFRRTPIMSGERQENDAEHSWHISVMALLLKDYYNKPVDIEKVIKMLLIHDLVEIYAGDTYAYDEKAYHDKADREQLAAEKLFSILPKAYKGCFMSLWEEFEADETNESEYASILDRTQPLLLNYHNEGRPWIKHGITKTQVITRVRKVIELNNPLSKYIMDIINDSVLKGYLIDN